MTTAFILDMIPTRMKEMGFGESYRVEFKSVRVAASSTLKVKHWHSWVWFPSDASMRPLFVESNFGCWSNTGTIPWEQQYEHTGKISIQNLDFSTAYVTMIIATPYPKPQKQNP